MIILKVVLLEVFSIKLTSLSCGQTSGCSTDVNRATGTYKQTYKPINSDRLNFTMRQIRGENEKINLSLAAGKLLHFLVNLMLACVLSVIVEVLPTDLLPSGVQTVTNFQIVDTTLHFQRSISVRETRRRCDVATTGSPPREN